MAELIDREPITKKVKNRAESEWNDTRRRAYMEFWDMLTSIPTVTEADIRAKAIDEFAERLCVELSEKAGVIKVHGVDFDILTVDGATEILLDVAEQLKEE